MPDIVIVSGVANHLHDERVRSCLRDFAASRFSKSSVYFFDLLDAGDTHISNDQVLNSKAHKLLAFLLRIRTSQGENIPFSHGSTSITETSEEKGVQEPMVLLGHDLGGLLIKTALLCARYHHEYFLLAKYLLIVFFNTPHRVQNDIVWQQFQFCVVTRSTSWSEQESRMMQLFYKASAQLQNEFATVFSGVPTVSIFEENLVDRPADLFAMRQARETTIECLSASSGTWSFEQIVISTDDSDLWLYVDSWLENSACMALKANQLKKILKQVCACGTMNFLPLKSRHLSHGLFKTFLGKSSDFKNCENAKECACLLFHGPPGFGSTELAMEVLIYISETTGRTTTADKSTTVLSYFFNGEDARSSSNEHLVRSLLIQLLATSPNAMRAIQGTLDFGLDTDSLGPEALWNILTVLLSHPGTGPIICIISEENGGIEWTYSLSRLDNVIKSCESARSPCKFFVAASQDSTLALENKATDVPLKNEMIQKMVRDLSTAQIRNIIQIRPVFKQVSLLQDTVDSFGDHLSDVLVKAAVLRMPRNGQNKKEAKYWLEKLTLSHQDFLGILLDSLPLQSISILSWMAVASRPFSVSELSIAISLLDNGQSLDEIEDCLSWSICREIRENLDQIVRIVDQEVHFCHQTLHDYVIKSEKHRLTHDKAAQRLLTYLTLTADKLQGLSVDNLRDAKTNSTPGILSLVEYAALYWPRHYQASSNPGGLIQLVDNVLDNEKLCQVLLNIIRPYCTTPVPDNIEFERNVTLASYFGVKEIVERHFRKNPDIGSDVSRWTSALVSAVVEGHRDLVMVFLDQRITTKEAILASSQWGRADILRDILKHVDNNESELMEILNDSLLLASERGHLSVMQELLNRNASPNKTTVMTGFNAIHRAAHFGHLDIITLFINSENISASTQSTNGHGYYSPMQLAAAGGYAHIVQALISGGQANLMESHQQERLPPIYLATKYGHLNVIKALIHPDWNIYSTLDSGHTVLHYAAEHGWGELVAWFLNHIEQNGKASNSDDDNIAIGNDGLRYTHAINFGAFTGRCIGAVDVETLKTSVDVSLSEKEIKEKIFKFLSAKDNNNYTALHLAAKFGHLDIVRLITHVGNSSKIIDASGPKDYRPLHFASESGYGDVVRYFIKTKAGIECLTHDHNTAVHLAAREGHTRVLHHLILGIQQAANASELLWGKNKEGLTALSIAAQGGYLSIVRAIVSCARDSLQELTTSMSLWENDSNALFAAIRAGHYEVVNHLLENGWQPNVVNSEGATPLQVAIESGDNSMIVAALLKKGASTELLPGPSYRTPLYMAVEQRRLEIVKIILEMRSNDDLNILCGRLKWSALHEANTKPDFLELLLKSKADPNVRNDYGSTPIILASEIGDPRSIQLLLDYKADPCVSNKTGSTALHRAVTFKHLEAVKILIDHGADINHAKVDGSTPLYWAYKSEKIARYLLESGADPNKTGGEYHSCIQFAAWMGKSELIEVLIEHKANVNAFGGIYGSPLTAAVADRSMSNVKLLLKNKADPNQLDHQGLSAFHRISTLPPIMDEDETQMFLGLFKQYGGTINVRNYKGLTPLVYAASKSNDVAMQALLAEGADLFEADGRQRSCLYWAAYNRSPECLNIILTWLDKYEPEKRRDIMSKAVHGAIIGNNNAAFQKLSSKGINVNEVDHNGWTPLATAIEYKRDAMEMDLRSNGAALAPELQKHPGKWNEYDKSSRLGVQDAECFAAGPSTTEQMKSDNDKPAFSTVRADVCAPQTERGVYYFEINIIKTGLDEIVAVGFCTDNTELNGRILGWDSGSWGFHGDNGSVYHSSGHGVSYAKPYSSGSIVGCGVDFRDRSIFFTVDGEFKGRAFHGDDIRGQLYPAVSLKPGNPSFKLIANFGPEFEYTITEAPGPWELGRKKSVDSPVGEGSDIDYASSVLDD